MPRIAAVLLALTSLPSTAAAAQTACPELRWVTLGTAGGPVPTPERAEPSNLLIAGEQRILVDTGDGTVNQLAKMGLQLGGVRTVVLSHLHLDHSGGLAAVIGLRWMNQFPGQLTVYGPPGTKAVVDGIVSSMGPPARIGFGLGVKPPAPATSVRVVEIFDNAKFNLGMLTVTAASNSHFDRAGALNGSEALSLGFRFQMGGRAIAYTGDTGPSAAMTRLARASDLLVSEVMDLDRLVAGIRQQRPDATAEMMDQMAEHLRKHHLTPADVGSMAAAAKVRRVVLTHFAVPGALAQAEPVLRSGVRQHFAGFVELAHDLASFDIGCAAAVN